MSDDKSTELRIRSRWWYILPIIFKVIGGVISYFAIRHDDPKKAKNCLYLGIIVTLAELVIFAVMHLLYLGYENTM